MKKYLNGAKFCHSPEDIPKGPHYAILEFGSVMAAGYDRGDPSYSTPAESYMVYETKEDWLAEIESRSLERGYGSNKWVALHVNPATVKLSASVTVDEKH